MLVAKGSVIGDVVDAYPQSAAAITRLIGDACFTCAGFRMETLEFAANIHGVDPELLISEIRKEIGEP